MEETCPICERHCQMTALSCKRGKTYFFSEQLNCRPFGFHGHFSHQERLDLHKFYSNQEHPEPQREPETKERQDEFDFPEDSGNQEGRLIALFYKCTHLFVHRNGQDQGKIRILSILYRKGDMTQRALLDHTDIRSASLSELLAKIEANGDIRRERSKEDGRNINITLTEKGKKAAEQFYQDHIQFREGIFAGLDQKEKEELEKLLTKLLSSWKFDHVQHHQNRHNHQHPHKH